MLLGFISLLLTVGQGPISNICVTESVGNTWHPCIKKQESKLIHNEHGHDHENTTTSDHEHGHRRLLYNSSDPGGVARRVLAGAGGDKCAAKAWNLLISLYFNP